MCDAAPDCALRKFASTWKFDPRVSSLILNQETLLQTGLQFSSLIMAAHNDYRMLPPTYFRYLPITDPLKHREWQRCAVVSSDAALVGKARGAEIDDHDFVMRFNFAPTGGDLAVDFGTKTSMYTLRHKSIIGILNPMMM